MKKYISINCKLNWSFWLSIFAIVISLITVALFFWKVDSNSVVNVSTFIGIITAFIGISVTLVIGFQIYSFISIKDKMNKMTLLKDELIATDLEIKKTKDNISALENELKGQILFSEFRSYIEKKEFFNGIKKLQIALTYFADLDSRKEDLHLYVGILNDCLELAKKEEWGEQNNTTINDYISSMKDYYLIIQKRKYYWVIKDYYNNFYSDLIKKLESFKAKA